MAQVESLGVQDLDFETRDGKTVKGVKLHIAYQDEHVDGLKADTKFLNYDLCKRLNVSAKILSEFIDSALEISTDLSGKVIGISPVKE